MALFDSGAERNYIKSILEDGDRVDEDIGFHIYEGIHKPILANTDTVEGEKIRFKEIHIKELSFEEPEFIVMEKLYVEAIIGPDNSPEWLFWGWHQALPAIVTTGRIYAFRCFV